MQYLHPSLLGRMKLVTTNRSLMIKPFLLLAGLALTITVNADNITFVDSHVKEICVEHWDTDHDGELSTDEAAVVLTLHNYFSYDEEVTSFDELQYFTSVQNLMTSEFSGCDYLTSIQLPAQLKTIGSGAFRNCIRLKSIDIPDMVTTINDQAFLGCFSLTSLRLGASLKTIAEMAFKGCNTIQSLLVPSSVSSISQNAFQGCTSLASITVAEDNQVYDSREDCNAIVTSSTNTILLGCYNTTFPSSVVAIGASAFYGCSRLQNINVPEGITSIGTSAFSSCKNLITAVLPTTLTTLGNSAFDGCSSLTDVHISEGLTTIEPSAFYGCRSLTHITIPSTVTAIKSYAFYECTSLVEVTVGFSTPMSISSTTFSNRKKATLYVPIGCVDAFKNANYWKEFNNIYEQLIPGDVNHDGSVNVLDVTLVIDYILDKNPENFHYEEANVNGDEYINVLDVTKIIDIILGK